MVRHDETDVGRWQLNVQCLKLEIFYMLTKCYFIVESVKPTPRVLTGCGGNINPFCWEVMRHCRQFVTD